jgi:hypothetical protein
MDYYRHFGKIATAQQLFSFLLAIALSAANGRFDILFFSFCAGLGFCRQPRRVIPCALVHME